MVTWVPRNSASTNRAPETVSLKLADDSIAISQNVFTWADHTLADEQYVVKVSSDIDKEVTAIIGCAVMTGAGAVENTAGVKKGDSVAIKELTTDDSKRNMAKLPVAGADFAFDYIGLKSTMEQILPAVRSCFFGAESGGTAVLVGVPTTTMELNAVDLLINEKKYIGSIGGSCCPDRDFPKYLSWYDEGLLDLNALVTARYSIDEINDATTALEQGKTEGRSILMYLYSYLAP